MWVRNGRAFAPPWICCRIGVSTSRKPLPYRVSRIACSTPAAGPDQVTGLGVHREVDISGPDPRLLVGQTLPLVGQRAQALADQPPAAHHQRLGARLAVPHPAGHLDRSPRSIASVKSAVVPFVQQRIVKQQLDFTGPVAQLGEQHAAVVPDPQHPPGHRHGRRRRRRRLPARRCGWAPARPGTRPLRCSCSAFSLAIRTRTCSGSRGPASTSGRSACNSATSGALPSWCNNPVATRFCGAEMCWPVCCLFRRENGNTRKPSAITDATPTRGISRASS